MYFAILDLFIGYLHGFKASTDSLPPRFLKVNTARILRAIGADSSQTSLPKSTIFSLLTSIVLYMCTDILVSCPIHATNGLLNLIKISGLKRC